MEKFIIQVEHDKAIFFKNLIENFDFAQIITEENIAEPRIYPSADFELRQKGDIGSKTQKSVSFYTGTNSTSEVANTTLEEENNLKQLRDAMSQINRIRDKKRN